MSLGRSLLEQVEESLKAGIETRIGADWEGRLEEWLSIVTSPAPDPDDKTVKLAPRCLPSHSATGVQDWSFPTDELRDAYIESISIRSDQEIFGLLRLFLFENSRFGRDDDTLDTAFSAGLDSLKRYPAEYRRRLLASFVNSESDVHSYPHPGVRWILDLLPNSPEQAIAVINAYLRAHEQILPDGRYIGLCDAVSIIQAKWMEPAPDATSALFELSPRDLERVAASLYRKLGYEIELTKPSKDGGRDVIAVNRTPGRKDHALIECKAHTSPVGVEIARALLGIVSNEHANRGVLITTSRFTRGARKLAESDHRLELIDGSTLSRILGHAFGNTWQARLDIICFGIDRPKTQAGN